MAVDRPEGESFIQQKLLTLLISTWFAVPAQSVLLSGQKDTMTNLRSCRKNSLVHQIAAYEPEAEIWRNHLFARLSLDHKHCRFRSSQKNSTPH
ncbi:hypothetical protein CEXT_245501 [Caerostris extrusa]|uniref:Secreted protein n=1 Tax=Caerostris extrusa TaxID=172846 RepID=A0AAV4YAI5_CAEEX|nr:hypothetical protein CEXT_245501 [Caerostris extrusa]